MLLLDEANNETAIRPELAPVLLVDDPVVAYPR